MFRNLLVAVLLLASLTACGKSSPTAPTPPIQPPSHEQPPNENGFEPLGTRHYLIEANGNSTKMWVELVEIKPLRGSKIVTGPFIEMPDCSLVCYTVKIRFGVDADLPPSMSSVLFKAVWTLDGTTVGETSPGSSSPQVCAGSASRGGEGECTGAPGPGSGGSTVFTTFNFVPKYLTVTGDYTYLPGGGGGSRKMSGKTSFETGYQPK